jgi:hypothetical protein
MRDVAQEIADNHSKFKVGKNSGCRGVRIQEERPYASSNKLTKREVAEQMPILAPYLREILNENDSD